MADLLLHSMMHYSGLTSKLLAYARPSIIVEVGAEYGGSTRVLCEYVKENKGVLHVIDPAPRVDVDKELSEFSGSYLFHEKTSLEVLSGLKGDVFFLDGDHNYWTVYNELRLIFRENPSAFVVLHDVGFPCARRDLYYSPASIPKEFLHDFTYTDGVGIDGELIVNGGFRGAGAFAFAKNEGGERNGVLTAVEDFLRGEGSLYYTSMPAIFGLGIICGEEHRRFVDELFFPYRSSLVFDMEKNRLELYLRVLSLQDELAKAKRWSIYGLARAFKKMFGF